MKIPRVIISGTRSGVGKTSITLGIILGIIKKGYTVQPFKIGPDYIDPGYLSSISNNTTRNLDMWIMGKDNVIKSFVNNSNSDISVIEGVMGFYDGAFGNSNFSSTHNISTVIKAPVILILDASKTARSIAAVALGYTKFYKNSHISGFILNKLHSKRHEDLCIQALQKLNLPILGSIYENTDLILNSRHLGLVSTIDRSISNNKIKKIADIISNSIDIDKLIQISIDTTQFNTRVITKIKKRNVVIAVALDQAFNFYYRDNLDALEREGARIEYFSPMHDETLPECNGIYLGGGYPELFGYVLENNNKMKNIIKKLAENEIPIYAECGGLMYLVNSIKYKNKKYRMTGLIDAETIMSKKVKVNYTKGYVVSNCVLSDRVPHIICGHEFHYSKVYCMKEDYKFAYKLSTGDGIVNKQDGLVLHNTLASYMHIYFDMSCYAKTFVNNCFKYIKHN